MKIALVTECYLPVVNGVVFCVQNIKKELEKEKHQVSIIAPNYGKNNTKEKQVFHAPSIPIGASYNFVLPYSREIKEILRKSDIIHTHHPFTMSKRALKISKKENIPLIFTHHTQYSQYLKYVPFYRRFAKNYLKNYLREFCDECSAIIAPSKGIKKEIENYKTKTKIHIIHNGIDISKFRGKGNPKPKEFGPIPSDHKILLFVGRVAHEKNLSFLIKSFKKILDKFEKVTLVIVGSGAAESDLKKLANELKLNKNVLFTGSIPREEIKKFYSNSHIFASASKTEVHPLVGLEAMASSLPIVALDAIGYEDIVENKINGYLCKEKSDEFSRKVLKILENPALLISMSRMAEKDAQNFTIKENVRKTLELYKSLVKKN